MKSYPQEFYEQFPKDTLVKMIMMLQTNNEVKDERIELLEENNELLRTLVKEMEATYDFRGDTSSGDSENP